VPGFLLHAGATVLCAHGGQAQPTISSSRVFVGGEPVTIQAGPYRVSACPQPSAAGGPCVAAQWTSAATRVRAEGLPVLLATPTAVCVPTGAPVQVARSQAKAIGS
jgi:hypothetical protein